MTIHDVIESHVEQATDADLLDVIAGPKARDLPLADLHGVESCTLTGQAGLTPAAARRLMCAIELGRRVANYSPASPKVIRSATAAFDLFRPRIAHLTTEAVEVAVLNVRLQLVSVHRVAEGTGWACAVQPRDILRPALVDKRGAAIVLAHNHPSGDPTPSAEDQALTRQVHAAADLLGVRMVDHIVVTPGRYTSAKDLGHF